MQGSKEVVGMKRSSAVDGVVREDTRRARASFTCVISNRLAERSREDRTDEVIDGAAAVKATLIDALPSGSDVQPLKAPLGQLVKLPGVSDTTNS